VHLSALEFTAAVAIVMVGGFVQGTIGFGLNLVIVPVVALLEPDAVPGAVLLLSFPMTTTMAWHERDHVDRNGVRHLLYGRIPGTLAGLGLLIVLDGDERLILVGASLFVAVVITAFSPTFHPGRRALVPAGFATGVTGTVAGIDGPPMALLYQHAPPPVMRATLAVMFAIGGVASALAAFASGDLQTWHLLLTVALMPAMLFGQFAAHRVRGRVPVHWFRFGVLAIAAIAAVSTTWRGLA
jgi:uncharacterized protein